MSPLFKKLKNNIGLDDEEEKNEEENEDDEEIEDEEEEEKISKKDKKKKDKKNKRFPEEKHNKKQEEWPESKGRLAADIYETETDFCIQAPIAGVNQEDIEIFVESNVLIIRGERTETDTTPEKKYFHKECYWGPFSRQTMLPDDVNTQRIMASFKKGVLIIKIPKKKEEKRKISIEMS
ncbi:MAG: Hsp20/alpha crystallin family protein [Candidatus Pacebacteria bacterium]|nr:Hsp20/alpha crystallin family protein [Candidatus Paceibacterota bacterium]